MRNFTFLFLLIAAFSSASAQEAVPDLFQNITTERGGAEVAAPGVVRTGFLKMANGNDSAESSLTEPSALAQLERVNLNLFQDVSLEVILETKPNRHLVEVDLYYGRTQDGEIEHPAHYRDVILTVNRRSQKMVIIAMTERGLFQVLPTQREGEYVAREYRADATLNSNCSVVGSVAGLADHLPPALISGCNEQDDNGDFVIDYLTAFSHEAVQDVGDINAYSVAQMETVNQGLANSLVDGVYLRLVDVAVRDGHVGIVSSWLSDGFELFEDDMIAVGADMIAMYQRPKAGVSNAGGWAGVPGRSSVNAAGSPTVFRHECGHNAGSAHCPGEGGVAAYSAGWNNGTFSTHMCGNTSAYNYFSTPAFNVDGLPIGDAATADNARVWRERASIMASYSQHVVPYDIGDGGTDNCAGSVADGVYYIQNVASNNYLQPDNNGNTGSKLFQTATNATTLEQWEFHHFSGNVYNVYNRSSQRVVDVFGSTGVTGPNVGLWTPNNTNNQRWIVEETPSGNYTLTNVSSGKCLYVSSTMTNAGDEVWQSECDGSTNAEWLITPVTGNPSLPIVSLATLPATCIGSENGSISATVQNASGNETYNWSDGSTGAAITNAPAGSYSVTVTDNGVNYFKAGSIASSEALIPEITIMDARTSTGGMIEITAVQNATGALSYAWSDGGPNTPIRNNLNEGDYTVTITDGNGCQDVREIRVQFSPDDGNYAIQHVATGLYLSTLDEENANETPVVLGECPNDNYNWFVYRNGSNGTVFRFRHVNSNRGLTVFGRNNIGEGYYIGNDANISTHRHILHRVSGNIFELQSQSTGYFAQSEGPEVESEIVMGELDGSSNFQFLLIPIPENCDPAAGTACDDNDPATEGDEVTILCDCCGDFNPALPVTLLDFFGRVRSRDNLLRWSTTNEVANAGFYVQRSLDGRRFEDIGFVAGSGTTEEVTNYQFQDDNPPGDLSFYRLRQVDTDGTETLSRIVDLNRKSEIAPAWDVFPNPINTKADQVTISGNPGDNLQLELMSSEGRRLQTFQLRLDEAGRGKLTLAALPSGVYLLLDQLRGEVRRLVLTD